MLQSGVLRFEPTDSLSSARSGSWPRECSEQLSNFCELLRLVLLLCVLARDANPLSIEIAGFSATGDNTST